MEPHVVRRRRAVLAGIIAALAVLLGGFAFVHWRAERSCAVMQQKVDELLAMWERREHRRGPLWGEGTPDRAFEHYQRASDAALALANEHDDALRELLPTRGDELPSAELRAAWQPLLAHLRAGAHATDLTPAKGRHGAPEPVIMNLLSLRWVANCALFETRAMRGSRDVEAVRVSLDSAMLGADLLRHDVLINRMIGAAVLATAMDAWFDDTSLARLDGDALALLANGLELLDRSRPTTPDLTGELLTTAHELQHLPDGPDAISAWQYGFSTRWLIADEWLRYANGVEHASHSASLPWPRRKAKLEADAQREAGGLLLPVAHVLLNVESGARHALTRVRLLRMAIEVHRGGDVTSLQDPLGDGPLQVTRGAGGVRITSAGSAASHPLERFVAR